MNEVGITFHESDRRLRRAQETAPEHLGTVIDFDRILAGLRRQRWVFATLILLMIVLAIAVTVTTSPTFHASATLMMNEEAAEGVEDFGAQAGLTASDLESVEQIFRARALALQVVERLDLADNPTFMNQPFAATDALIQWAMGVARQSINSVVALILPEEPALDGTASTDAELADGRRQSAARSLQQEIGVRRLGRSTAIQIS